jgi:hypothetical protein
LVCGPIGLQSSRADTLDDRLAEARAAAVKRLEKVVAWCQESQVFAERDRVYATILVLAPDHERARSVLKYTRPKKGGPWERGGYVEPKNWNKGLVPEAAKRLEGALAEYRDAVQGALGAGIDVDPGRRSRVLEQLVDLLPNDVEVRRPRGDVQHEGRWLLPETVEGIVRRKAMQAMLERAKAAVPPVRSDPTAVEKRWRSGVTCEHFGVCGYVDEIECVTLVRLMEAGHSFLAELLGTTDVAPTPKRVLLMEDSKIARTWLFAQGPEHAEAQRIFPHVTALWLPSGTNMQYHSDATVRRVGTLRQVIQRAIEARTTGDRDRGWVSEGLGQRLTWHVSGQHGSAFVSFGQTESAEGRNVEQVLPAPNVEWLSAAARVLQLDPVPRLESVLTMRLNAMRIDDVLVAYALGAFLLEGRPESLSPFLKASLSIDSADRQCLDVFGVDAATLAWRLRRWTMETSSL